MDQQYNGQCLFFYQRYAGGLTASSPSDVIVCEVTVTDNNGDADTSSNSVTVDNTAPTLSSVTITPNISVYNNDTLTCAATATDPDNVSVVYAWTVAGSSVGSGASLDLATTAAIPTDTVECTASVTDSDGGSATDSATIIVDNRAPSSPTVSISPATPIEGQDDLVCTGSGSTDADGQTVTYTYTWTSDLVVVYQGLQYWLLRPVLESLDL